MRNIAVSALLFAGLCLIFSCKPTTNIITCAVPTGLTTVSITGYSATLKWNNVKGDTFYSISYQPLNGSYASQSWSSADTATVSYLYGNTTYQWQVSYTCPSTGYQVSSAPATFQTGAPIGSCSFDSLLYFMATNVVGSPSTRSLTAYGGVPGSGPPYTSTAHIAFVFSSYPTASGSYLVVAPGSSISGNTVAVTATLDSNTVNTSTGGDHVYANITVTGGKINLSLPRVETASTVNPSDSAPFYNIIINQP